MKKIKITENELISLIEKIVNENLGSTPSLSAHGGGFSNLGIAKPTDKYKDLYEDDDIEGEIDEDEDPAVEKSDAISVDVGKDVEDGWTGRNPSPNMESIVNRLKGKLNEVDGKGCAGKDAGCIRAHGGGFRILNNKVGGWFKSKKGDVYDYKTRADAKAALASIHM